MRMSKQRYLCLRQKGDRVTPESFQTGASPARRESISGILGAEGSARGKAGKGNQRKIAMEECGSESCSFKKGGENPNREAQQPATDTAEKPRSGGPSFARTLSQSRL